ncbi:MAG: ATP-binding protein [Cyanobacteria bacterium J06626_6]
MTTEQIKEAFVANTSSPIDRQGKGLLARFKVSQRITFGFAFTLGLAFAGTAAGILVGNAHQKKALETEHYLLEEVRLLSQIQAGVLQARTHQQQLIPLSEFPEDFKDEYSHILEHAKTVDSVWRELTDYLKDPSDHGYGTVEESPEIRNFLNTYNRTYAIYFEELAGLVESVEPNENVRPEAVANAQRRLMAFTNSPLAIRFDAISDDLSGIIKAANAELLLARQAVTDARKLRNQLILISMLLSSGVTILLALSIVRSINRPLRQLEGTALQISQSDRFDLRAEVASDDEVGTVAAAFNELLHRVERLIEEQTLRSQELEQVNCRLISTQSQMIAQEKLASLGSLTAGIAHEIKNPLNFVNNFSEIAAELAEDLVDAISEHREQLDPAFCSEITETIDSLKTLTEKIYRHGKRADDIVADMLQHSRDGESEWVEADINELVKKAVNLAYHGMRAKHSNFNLSFDNDYADNLGEIRVSPKDLSRVFLNIVSNACYAVYQRQLAEGASFAPLLKVRTRRQDGEVVVHIRDNGPGMSAEVKNKVFEQFFTTKPTGEGTGLGLSLSYNIVVEQHQGAMVVESEEGIYTDFIVTLPA